MRPADTAMASGEDVSDTPITDFAEYEVTPEISRMLFGEQSRLVFGVVTSDTARTLERDLSAAQERIKELEEVLRLAESRLCNGPARNAARAALKETK